ncbi:ABC transporter ATP-binding protein [Hansschlegelia plantiphila]|uniref:Spermidine/putrescine import ATP-binding protein PotA n=1 Tax=Hansschlegelia plantiphila TaxID=374655 RepID=A0A9W6J613_9HYPH|nr:ABC transporter ATP-binding protein [Hansschlegelia plantiphila]GLK69875.1 spermidine/putrescine import ATP-binding protein PotA [Hansschlegelia plantiphila]
MTTPPIVELYGVTKSFGAFTVLNDIDLKIADGEILTLLGPSGCGKTTLMRIVAGFEQSTHGRVLLRGVDVSNQPPERRPVNMVFQRYALFPHLDVFDNVAFGLRLKKKSKSEIKKTVTHMLELVQLGEYANRWITELSGGQAQRVALARALVNEPSVLLLDEPLAALDLKIRHHMLAELKRIHVETGTTFIYVTHDQDEATILSDRIVLMNKGAIEQIGTPEEMYARPQSLFCAKFLGETNILSGSVISAEGDTTYVDIGAGAAKVAMNGVPVGSQVSLAVRPEAIRLDKVREVAGKENFNFVDGVIQDVVFMGSRVVYNIRTPINLIKYQETRPVHGISLERGDEVRASWAADAAVLLTH